MKSIPLGRAKLKLALGLGSKGLGEIYSLKAKRQRASLPCAALWRSKGMSKSESN